MFGVKIKNAAVFHRQPFTFAQNCALCTKFRQNKKGKSEIKNVVLNFFKVLPSLPQLVIRTELLSDEIKRTSFHCVKRQKKIPRRGVSGGITDTTNSVLFQFSDIRFFLINFKYFQTPRRLKTRFKQTQSQFFTNLLCLYTSCYISLFLICQVG